MSKELWKPVVGFPDYEVSDHGNVRVAATQETVPFEKSRVKTCRRVNLKNGPRVSKKRVHVLVLETFVGRCPAGMECFHLDGDTYNCRLENLEWKRRKWAFGAM